MKLTHLIVVAVLAMVLVDTLAAQEIYSPGNGVTLPVVVKEVQPTGDITATVSLRGVVQPSGLVNDIAVTSSPDPKLNAAAVEALSRWVFKPGTRNGQPVAVRISVQMNFTTR